MKKTIATLVMGGFLAAALVGCGPNTTPSEPNKTPSPNTPSTDTGNKTVTGKVVKVDGNKLTAKVGDAEKTYTVPDSAKVTTDGKDGKIGDAKADNGVSITTDKSDNVTKVDITTK